MPGMFFSQTCQHLSLASELNLPKSRVAHAYLFSNTPGHAAGVRSHMRTCPKAVNLRLGMFVHIFSTSGSLLKTYSSMRIFMQILCGNEIFLPLDSRQGVPLRFVRLIYDLTPGDTHSTSEHIKSAIINTANK